MFVKHDHRICFLCCAKSTALPGSFAQAPKRLPCEPWAQQVFYTRGLLPDKRNFQVIWHYTKWFQLNSASNHLCHQSKNKLCYSNLHIRNWTVSEVSRLHTYTNTCKHKHVYINIYTNTYGTHTTSLPGIIWYHFSKPRREMLKAGIALLGQCEQWTCCPWLWWQRPNCCILLHYNFQPTASPGASITTKHLPNSSCTDCTQTHMHLSFWQSLSHTH